MRELILLVPRLSLTELLNTGFRMKKLAAQHYCWATIAQSYAGLFHSFDYAYQRKSVRPRIARLDPKALREAGLAHLSHTQTAIA